MSEVTQKRQNWFKKFIVFLLAVVVAISLGLVVYYFTQDDETLGINQSSLMVNKGEKFTVKIIHENEKKDTTYELQLESDGVLKCLNKDTAKDVYEYEAISGGSTKINLITNNPKYQNMSCSVTVGVGTQTNPYFIKTPEDLASIGVGNAGEENYRGLNMHYVQLNSIDLANYNGGVWTPLGGNDGFSGVYDGAGFAIYNLNITSAENTNAGLFTKINQQATVTRIIFEKPIITGKAQNAGVVAGINSGTISRIEVKNASISIENNSSESVNVGGIVGKMERETTNTRLDRVAFYKNGAVSLTTNQNGYVGGIVGYNLSGTVINSFSRGVVIGVGDYTNAGGIAGKVITANLENLSTSKKGNIINSYTTAEVKQANKMGAIVGAFENVNGSKTYDAVSTSRFVGVYYVKEGGTERNINWMSGALEADADIDGFKLVTAISMQQAKMQETYKTFTSNSLDKDNPSSWDFDNVWEINETENDGLPMLRMMGSGVSDNIYDPTSAFDDKIVSQVDLMKINNDLNATYEIGRSFKVENDMQPLGVQADGTSNQFNGILKGNGYTITIANGVSFESLFGVLGPDAQISDLNIIILGQISTSTDESLGIVARYNNGLIERCKVSGHITITSGEDKKIGGIVGTNGRTGQIIDCSAGSSVVADSVNITAIINGDKTFMIGGIAGENQGTIKNTNVFEGSSINVTNENGAVYAGGIAGQNTQSAVIESVVAKLSIKLPTDKDKNIAGGIVGYNSYRATITKAKVEGIASEDTTIEAFLIGGLVGENSAEDINTFESITRSQVQETTLLKGNKAGGLVGRLYRGVVTNSATFAKLSASTMAGFAVTVEGYTNNGGSGKYAKIDTCFSSATFDGNAGKAYAETTSLIRATNNYLGCLLRGEDTNNPDSFKIAGYINNSKYNKTNLEATGQDEKNYRQYSSAYIAGYNYKEPRDGATSVDNCKKASTFDLKTWSSSIWDIVEGKLPTLKF